MDTNKGAIAMDAPYSVLKSTIESFGDKVGVRHDGNCFFTALWEAKHQYVVKKDEIDMNDHRLKIHKYASKNWEQMVLKVHDSYGKSHYGTMRRKTFDSKDLELKLEADNAAIKRCKSFFDWYKSKVLFPIYEDSHDFNQGVSQQYWGNIRYHGPISALK